MGFFDFLTGGESIDRPNRFQPPPEAPEASEEQVVEFFRQNGVPDEAINIVLADETGEASDRLFMSIMKRLQGQQQSQSERQPIIDRLGMSPEDAQGISTRALQNQADARLTQTGGDRSQLAHLFPPHMQNTINNLPDDVFNDLVKAQSERQLRGQNFERRQGAGNLRIVQDAAFQRANLQPGQVVCIKIPGQPTNNQIANSIEQQGAPENVATQPR